MKARQRDTGILPSRSPHAAMPCVDSKYEHRTGESSRPAQFPDPCRRNTLENMIAATWAATVGRPPGELTSDLAACRRWFDPVAQGQRLRRELSALPPLPLDIGDPGPPFVLRIGPDKRLVTPEGRCALDLLQALRQGPRLAITDGQLFAYDRLLAELYRDWTRHRLQSVVDLLTGSTKPLQVPAAGVVIALLVNRCTSERRALTRFASGSARDVVDGAFFTPVQAFAEVLAPRRRGNRSNPRLVSGWMLYEARRRLGGGLVLRGRPGRPRW